jgi:hypothetical protein
MNLPESAGVSAQAAVLLNQPYSVVIALSSGVQQQLHCLQVPNGKSSHAVGEVCGANGMW